MQRCPKTSNPATLAVALLLVAVPASAQSHCLEPAAFGPNGVDGYVLDLFAWDDGGGEELYVAGDFEVAGNSDISGVARWSGGELEPVGSGLPSSVRTLGSWDDGSGNALYAGGEFRTNQGAPGNHVVRWDGSAWSAVGSIPYAGATARIRAMAVFDDGSGEALYVAGNFISLDGAGPNIARWDGTAWTSVGDSTGVGEVYGLLAHDAGNGPRLYALSSASRIKRWNGTGWTNVQGNFHAGDGAIIEHDDGAGPALYVAGGFDDISGLPVEGVARWDGGTVGWSAVGSGHGVGVFHDMVSMDDGTGPALFGVGYENGAPWNYLLVKWDGTSWTRLATFDGWTTTVAPFDAGGGATPFVGGWFERSGDDLVAGIGRWNGAEVEPISSAAGGQVSQDRMNAFGAFDDGSGPRLYADRGERVEAWDGTSWSPTAGPPADGDVRDLLEFDDGTGNALWAGGLFREIGGVSTSGGLARWDGSTWSEPGGGVVGDVYDLAVTDLGSGPVLVVGGELSSAGGLACGNVVLWDGELWTPLGAAFDGHVTSTATWNGALFAGGLFTTVDGVLVNRVARWNGAAWAPVSSGMDAGVYAMTTFDRGSGPELVAAGNFLIAGGSAAVRMASWNGTTWTPFGAGLDTLVRAVTVFDDGTGDALIAGGRFENSGVDPVRVLARWDGADWVALPGAPESGIVSDVFAFDDGTGLGESLFVGGTFSSAGGVPALRMSRYSRECPCPPRTYCTAKTSSLGCVPAIGSSGVPSASNPTGFLVTCTSTLADKSGLFFYSTTGPKEAPFQGGWLCVKAPTRRTGLQNSGGVPPCGGLFSFDFNAHIAGGSDPFLEPGQVVWGQYWSRDPQASFNTNRSDAIEFLICP